MKIIYSNIIPFKGFIAVNLFGILFVRKEYKGKLRGTDYVHEAIHTAQMKELGYVGFYIIYFFEWLWRCITPPWPTAYNDISFEREARKHEKDGYKYLDNRKHYAQWKQNEKE